MRAQASSQGSKVVSEAAQAALNERHEQVIQFLNNYYNKNKEREKQSIGGPAARSNAYQRKRAMIQQEAENTLIGKAMFITVKESPFPTLDERIQEAQHRKKQLEEAGREKSMAYLDRWEVYRKHECIKEHLLTKWLRRKKFTKCLIELHMQHEIVSTCFNNIQIRIIRREKYKRLSIIFSRGKVRLLRLL